MRFIDCRSSDISRTTIDVYLVFSKTIIKYVPSEKTIYRIYVNKRLSGKKVGPLRGYKWSEFLEANSYTEFKVYKDRTKLIVDHPEVLGEDG